MYRTVPTYRMVDNHQRDVNFQNRNPHCVKCQIRIRHPHCGKCRIHIRDPHKNKGGSEKTGPTSGGNCQHRKSSQNIPTYIGNYLYRYFKDNDLKDGHVGCGGHFQTMAIGTEHVDAGHSLSMSEKSESQLLTALSTGRYGTRLELSFSHSLFFM